MKVSPRLQLFSIFLFVAIINIRVGQVIMGFDNSSPFFNASATLSRIFNTDNFFHYGGMLFSPGFLMSLLQIPAWLNSYLTYFVAMVIGMFFISLIVHEYSEVKTSQWPWIIALVLLGNLLPIWFFSIPLLIFAPSFAGIPTLLYVLMHKSKKGEHQNILLWIPVVIGLLYFYSTCINVVAFALYFVETLLLAYILRDKTHTIGNLLKRALIVAGIWVLIVQGILLTKSPPRFIVSEAINYGIALSQDNKSSDVTTSLFRMETQRNSIVNVARFATGWVSLTNGKNEYIFAYKNIVDSLFGIVITVLPIATIVYYLIINRKTLGTREKQLVLIWMVTIALTSAYALPFLRLIPYLGTVLRWISSKMWPLLFVPYAVFLFAALTSPKVHAYVKMITYLCLGIISLSWIPGIVNKYQHVTLPQEYITTFGTFSQNDTVLYLPEPQRLYMRQYTWGYYGSGFLTYLTSAKILDNGSFHPEQNSYDSLTKAFKNCDLDTLKSAGVTAITVDQSTITGEITIPSCYDSTITTKNSILTVIKL